MNLKERARELLKGFKGEDYTFGFQVLSTISDYASTYGKRILVIGKEDHLKPTINQIRTDFEKKDIVIVGNQVFAGAHPNTPMEDVYRITSYILHFKPDCVVAIGGGSTLDAVKAANVLATLGSESPDIDSYFGVGLVTEALERSGKELLPILAVQTASSSGAHLTKYANITNMYTKQKKLIVDPAVIPKKAVFDYGLTQSMPMELTIDGALDGMAHCLEVYFGSTESFELLTEITSVAMGLTLDAMPVLLQDPKNLDARESLGLATDLGGYAIMIGGTNGAHLTSFSLINLTSHGKACGIMNPYYTVFFSPAIGRQLKVIANVFNQAGIIDASYLELTGRELGECVAHAMITFAKSINAATTLGELTGFSLDYIGQALAAAKNPQLEMKLKNMPVPLNSSLVDKYMEPILQAAVIGDFRLIKTMS